MPKYESYETAPFQNQYGTCYLWIKYRSDLRNKPEFKKKLAACIAEMHTSNFAETSLLRPGRPYELTIRRRKIDQLLPENARKMARNQPETDTNTTVALVWRRRKMLAWYDSAN